MKSGFDEKYDTAFGEKLTKELFSEGNTAEFKRAVNVSFENYLGLKSESPSSQLAQACCAAWLIPRIMANPNFVLLEKTPRQEFIAHLDELFNKYFSSGTITKTYAESSPGNTEEFKQTKKRVIKKIQSIPCHYLIPEDEKYQDYRQLTAEHTHNGNLNIKALFLDLFIDSNKPTSAVFFKPASTDFLAVVKKSGRTSLEWHTILAELSSDESLLDRIEFFAAILQSIEDTLIPDLNKLDELDIDIKESSLSMKY